MERLPPIVRHLRDLSNEPSPSGFTHQVIRHVAALAKKAGLLHEITTKGALLVNLHPRPKVLVSGHIDTLGAMVSEIRSDGHLRLTPIGGLLLPTFEGGYASVVTTAGRRIRGTFLLDNPAAHVNKDAGTTERKMERMFFRLDAEVEKREDTAKLGIQIGDYVCFDPRFEFTSTRFIKSHFLDDKAGSAVMIDVMLDLARGKSARPPVSFFFSNYEEVGHGACAGIPATVEEMLVVDMGVVGNQVQGDEFCVSICVKDSSGPYDYDLRCRLTDLARKKNIPFKLDVFPYYGSDGSAALRAGHNLRVGLIGPGVSASHGMERTHLKGLNATKDLLMAFLEDSRLRFMKRPGKA